MTQFTADRPLSAPPLPATPHARGLIRLICTSNPFYVLSAGLFLVGLWISFGAQTDEVETYALMSGLAGYTLLLAVTAFFLVRFAGVWDDVRTVLLLVVLMFLATSVTFDDVLVSSPARGVTCYLVGLLFAVLVSEGLLRGIRLRLPVELRVPYYLILALFFLYPLALRALVDRPRDEGLTWGLFAFSTVAGLLFLTLLPAIRRGPELVRDNGSPWRWPLYPWTLFGLLAFAVPARAFFLCWSMDVLIGADQSRLIFGLYFLVPFGLALAVLLLEIGLVGRRPQVIRLALGLPIGLIGLAALGHRSDPIYQGFLQEFSTRLGVDPLYATLVALAGFYAWAALRRVPLALPAVTAALVALAVVPPDSLTMGVVGPARPVPLLAVSLLLLVLGVRKRSSGYCLAGSAVLIAAVKTAIPEPDPVLPIIGFHLALLAALIIGAAFDDVLAGLLRLAAVCMAISACGGILLGGSEVRGVVAWVVAAYPFLLAVVLAMYGWLLRDWVARGAGVVILSCWLLAAGWRGYVALRQIIVGLDHMTLSLALFGLAILISLYKAGLVARWWATVTKNRHVAALVGDHPHGIQVEVPTGAPLVTLSPLEGPSVEPPTDKEGPEEGSVE
jgi:hypothetical protein